MERLVRDFRPQNNAGCIEPNKRPARESGAQIVSKTVIPFYSDMPYVQQPDRAGCNSIRTTTSTEGSPSNEPDPSHGSYNSMIKLVSYCIQQIANLW